MREKRGLDTPFEGPLVNKKLFLSAKQIGRLKFTLAGHLSYTLNTMYLNDNYDHESEFNASGKPAPLDPAILSLNFGYIVDHKLHGFIAIETIAPQATRKM